MDNQHRRSFFWPIILVGAGLILLLRNLGVLPAFSWQALISLWPLLLIVLGLDILFGRRAPWFGSLVGLLAVVAVIGLFLLGPSIGFNTASTIETEVFSSPIGGATSALYQISGSSEPVNIYALENEDELIHASITHNGAMEFNVSGDADKTVQLSAASTDVSLFFWDWSLSPKLWDIGISPLVSARLNLDGGSGALTVDLTGMQLQSLTADLGSGASTFTLSQSNDPYEVEIESGSGSVTVKIAEATNLDLILESGSGSININLPGESAVRVEVLDDGSGSLNIPPSLESVSTTTAFSQGAWQSEGYEEAAYKITILIRSRGSGSINIH